MLSHQRLDMLLEDQIVWGFIGPGGLKADEGMERKGGEAGVATIKTDNGICQDALACTKLDDMMWVIARSHGVIVQPQASPQAGEFLGFFTCQGHLVGDVHP